MNRKAKERVEMRGGKPVVVVQRKRTQEELDAEFETFKAEIEAIKKQRGNAPA